MAHRTGGAQRPSGRCGPPLLGGLAFVPRGRDGARRRVLVPTIVLPLDELGAAGARPGGALALAVGALVTRALLTRPPVAPGVARTPEGSAATLPAMLASMGFWGRIR